jgi:hypothetical protein
MNLNSMCKANAHRMCAGYVPAKHLKIDRRNQFVTREKLTVNCECACHTS